MKHMSSLGLYFKNYRPYNPGSKRFRDFFVGQDSREIGRGLAALYILYQCILVQKRGSLERSQCAWNQQYDLVG